MKTLLILAQHPELPEALLAALDPKQYRLVHRLNVEELEPLLGRGMLDACIIDADLMHMQVLWAVEKMRRRLPACPIIVFTGSQTWELEEEAYLQGVSHVLQKPVRARLINTLLERLFQAPTPIAPRPVPARPAAASGAKSAEGAHSPLRALEVLRDFSSILTHSLSAEPMLKQFLLMLREIIGVNRAAIFLRRPATPYGGPPSVEQIHCMRSACAIGLSPGLLEHFELSFESGIGGHLFRNGRILRRENDEVQHDREMQKEFELLGVQVAIPMFDRETLIGVATLDGRITGEPIVNGELELIFHLLEELSLAVKNIWLHDQLSANHAMLSDILRELQSACVVVGRDLTLLHANKAARNYFSKPGRRSSELEFSDLPQILGSKTFQVLKTGSGVATFKYHPPESPNSIYHVNIVPLQRANAVAPDSALLVVEDFTQAEHFRKLELEATNLRLVKTISERLAHEIGNAVVPIHTYQQLFADKYQDPDFRASFDAAMAQGVKRVIRLTSQLRYLARDGAPAREAFPVAQLVDESFDEAKKTASVRGAKLRLEDSSQPIIVAGDRTALKHALTEVLLNAIQANPSDPKVTVRTSAAVDANGQSWIHLDVLDTGAGFNAEAAQKGTEPFFTTRTVGIGLGLSVTRKIVEQHQGSLALLAPKEGQPNIVRVSVPSNPLAASA